MKAVKVWSDEKRGCYTTNAAIIMASRMKISTLDASVMLMMNTCDALARMGVESVEYEEPGRGVLWRVEL